MFLNIKVITRASKNELIKLEADGYLKAKLTAVPIKGRANQELIKLLSRKYSVSKNKINIIKGINSNKKIVEIVD